MEGGSLWSVAFQPSPSLILVIVGTFALMAGVAVILTKLIFSVLPKPVEEPVAGRPTIPVWFWLPFLVAGLAIGVWYPRPQAAKRPPHRATQGTPLVAGGAVIALLGAVVALRYFRSDDSALRRASNRAKAGDVEGAIADMQALIEKKGLTVARLNHLSGLLTHCERWDEAAALYRRGMELGQIKAICQVNLGIALLKLGRPEEAFAELQEVARNGPWIPVVRCLIGLYSALALTGLDRRDEALKHLEGAESAARALPRAQRAAWGNELEKYRKALEDGSLTIERRG
jgi:tetratricopeptide (TPR) repeat protein